ncbi:MAG: hypothetical protein O3B72_05200 [Proteobacteria bacterium]|nr:hypothetical protein [Pseudomonadota bacterium]
MKSKIAGLAFVLMFFLVLAGSGTKLAATVGYGGGLSFREQLNELVYARDTGVISETTYRFRRQQITGVMMH